MAKRILAIATGVAIIITLAIINNNMTEEAMKKCQEKHSYSYCIELEK